MPCDFHPGTIETKENAMGCTGSGAEDAPALLKRQFTCQ